MNNLTSQQKQASNTLIPQMSTIMPISDNKLVPNVPQNLPEPGVEGDTAQTPSTPTLYYHQTDLTKLTSLKPQSKSAKGKDASGKDTEFKYYEIHIIYEYPNGVKDTFDFEIDEEIETSGITYNNGKPSIMAKFRNNDQLVAWLGRLYSRSSEIVDVNKEAVDRKNYLVQHPESCSFKPIAFVKNEGSRPTHFFKLTRRSLFTDLKGNPIDWKLMQDVDAKIVPKLRYSHIFVNGQMIAAKIILLSAIVTSVVRAGSETTQLVSIKKFAQKNPNAVKSVEESLKKMKLASKDETSMPPPFPSLSSKNTDKAVEKKDTKTQPQPSAPVVPVPSDPPRMNPPQPQLQMTLPNAPVQQYYHPQMYPGNQMQFMPPQMMMQPPNQPMTGSNFSVPGQTLS